MTVDQHNASYQNIFTNGYYRSLNTSDNISISAADIPDRALIDDELVSVIVPTYDDEQYLPFTIESVAQQTHPAVELVIVDSSGVEWLKSFSDSHDWITYLETDPEGVSKARNDGIQAASGDYIALLDADDCWHPKKLSYQLDIAQSGNSVIYNDYLRMVDMDDNPPNIKYVESDYSDRNDAYIERISNEVSVATSSLLFDSDIVPNRPFLETLEYGEDKVFVVELFKDYPPSHIGEALTVYRKRSGSLTSSSERYKFRNDLLAYAHIMNKHPELIPQISDQISKKAKKKGIVELESANKEQARVDLLYSMQWGGISSSLLVLYIITRLPFEPRIWLNTARRFKNSLSNEQ